MAKRKKKKTGKNILFIIVIIIIAILVYLKFFKKTAETATTYKTEKIQTIDIESIVSSTGTLAAVGTVDIGTQVSGKIESISADFNDEVKKDEVLAILDRTTLKLTYKESEAKLRNAQSQYKLKKEQFANDSTLYHKELISEFEYLSSETDLVNSETSLISAEVALERADKNLNEYAIIKAPIDGVIISREIEVGQTVQASTSAPTLFVMAKDLHNMEIEALVDESDIGLIKENQKLRFTVEAYMDEEFTGYVEQVRMQPSVVSNVVHYTVICSADNSQGLLLPGMTATIDFIVDNRENVTAVSNSALSVKMPLSVMEEMRNKMQKNRNKSDNKDKKGNGMRSNSQQSENMSRLWYLDTDGNIGMTIVKKGLSDGINTEITLMKEIPEGAEIITKVSTTEETSKMPQPPGSMMRSPGLF